MSTEDDSPKPYQVIYSQRVREKPLQMADVARARGDGPQFGDPLRDLREHTGQIRLGVVPPVAMRYGVDEEIRLLFGGGTSGVAGEANNG